MKCSGDNIDINTMDDNPVSQWYQSFVDQGKAADYTQRRGSKTIVSFITYTEDGPRSYLAGRPAFFPDEFEVNNGVLKAIELVGEEQMEIIPYDRPLDNLTNKFKEGYLILTDQCNIEVARIPLTSLCLQTNGGKWQFTNMAGLQWNKCAVLFPNSSGISSANGLMFKLYIDPPANGIN